MPQQPDAERSAENPRQLLSKVTIIVLCVIAACVLLTSIFATSNDTRSDFYVEKSEDVTFPLSSQVADNTKVCDLTYNPVSTPESRVLLVTAATSGGNCTLEVRINRHNGKGFVDPLAPADVLHFFTLATPAGADLVIRMCNMDGQASDQDCKIYRLNGDTLSG